MYSLLDTTSIVTCTVNNSSPNNGTTTTGTTQIVGAGGGNRSPSADKLGNGINVSTNYRLCSLDKGDTLMGDSVQLVRLRDPMAMATFGTTSGYNGDWSSLSGTWDRVSIQERDRLLGQLDIGEFWISFSDLTQIFSHLECVHLDSDTARDEPSLADKTRKWMMRMFQGAWRKGVTAGGCRNNPDSFHINPQLQLFLTEKEDVIISLNQHSVMEPKVIGFTLYNLSNSEWMREMSVGGIKLFFVFFFAAQTKVTECLPKSFFKKHKSLLNSQYTNSRQISQRCSIEPGRYLIMATTFEPMEESAFSIRVLGTTIRLALLETQTMLLLDPFPYLHNSQKILQTDPNAAGTAQYEPVFLQLADDHK